MGLIKKFTEAAFQRNGVSGEAFFVVRFQMANDFRKGEVTTATAIIFDAPCYCAVITDNLKEHWRGDHFEPELRAFIKTRECHEMCWPGITFIPDEPEAA